MMVGFYRGRRYNTMVIYIAEAPVFICFLPNRGRWTLGIASIESEFLCQLKKEWIYAFPRLFVRNEYKQSQLEVDYFLKF